jgi:beta-glucanase (GH16 family)
MMPLSGASTSLVFQDEFNGTAVDTGKWRVKNNTWANNELSMLTNRSSNIYVSTGTLKIKAKREVYSVYGQTRQYTSAYIDRVGKGCWQYGIYEMRARLPTAIGVSKGLWPAFWLRPQAGGQGEIDIMEAIGTSTYDDRVSQTLWYDYARTKPRLNLVAKLPSGLRSTGFHVYTLDWQRNLMRWYIDGKLTWQLDPSNAPWITDSRYNQPYCMRVNLQVGGHWPGTPDSATNFSQTMAVDYVRVWKRA